MDATIGGPCEIGPHYWKLFISSSGLRHADDDDCHHLPSNSPLYNVGHVLFRLVLIYHNIF